MPKNQYLRSLFTSLISISPIVILILILSWTNLAPFKGGYDYLLLFLGAFVLIIGLTLFQIGAKNGITKVGEYMGSYLSKETNIFIVILFAFLLGALITCAEPSILIVASDVSIPSWLLVGGISIGVGIFVVVGIVRIILHGKLKIWYLFLYAISFMLIAMIEDGQFLPFIFDSGGITTGSATVPFILALGAGVATVRSGKNAHADSFGVVGVASIGPIMTMTIIVLINHLSGADGFSSYQFDADAVVNSMNNPNILGLFGYVLTPHGNSMGVLLEVLIALLPIIAIFLIYNFIFIKLPKQKILQLLFGFFISFVGLVFFLSGVGAAMSPIGKYVGVMLGRLDNGIIIAICFIVGMVTILCEPAVHVLTTQIEEISDGTIKKTTVLLILSVGVGLAIGLSAIRSIFNFSIMYYIIPGYIICIVLMMISPDLYVAIAFDSGGTASGPLAVSFVLPMIIGMTYVKSDGTANIYQDAFGVIGLIAMIPIFAIELLGAYDKFMQYNKLKIMRERVLEFDDNQIIHF